MEFVDLSRYIPVKGKRILPFSELRRIDPVYLTWDLQLDENTDNIAYAHKLAEEGNNVVPIQKLSPSQRFLNRDSFPRRILFEMTSRCNFNCRMCPQQNLKRPRMDMPGEDYRRVVDEIDEHGVEGLWLYHLGEPLLHPEFEENVMYVAGKRNLGVIWMSTNGQYFDEDKIDCVLNANIDYVNFSAHAVTEGTYKTVAPDGVFHTVQANLHKFYEKKGTNNLPSRPFMHCQMIEQETTRHEVDDFLKKHYKLADIVSVNMLEYVNLPNNTFGFEQRKRRPLKSCTRVSRNDCFIMSNGHVTLCDAAYNGEIDLGSIYENSLYEIWNGEKRKEILELNRQGRMYEIDFCRQCTDYDI